MARMPTRFSAIFAGSLWRIMLAAILWGTVGVTTQTLYHLSTTNPLSVGFFRLALSTPCLLALSFGLLGRGALQIARRDLGTLLVIGAMLALYQACFFASIARVGVTVATLVTLCAAPLLVALLSAIFLGERLTRPTLWALLGALVGIICVVGGQSHARAQHADLLGVIFALGSAMGYAMVTLLGRTVAGRYHPLQITTVGFGFGAIVLLPLALATGFVTTYPVQGWLLLGYLGVVPTALAYGLFMSGLRNTPATVTSILTLLEPLTATFLAALLFGERLGPLGIVGAGLLVGALLLLARGETSQATLTR